MLDSTREYGFIKTNKLVLDLENSYVSGKVVSSEFFGDELE